MYSKFGLDDLLSDPLTGEKLDALEPWLRSSGDALYPALCRTPVVQPWIDDYLKGEYWNVARAFAELGFQAEERDWFMARYGGFTADEPRPQDTAILGEGYPGFWDALEVPEFLRQMDVGHPEEILIGNIPKRRYGIGLDLGCGQGGMTQMMAPLCQQVYGVEINFYLAAIANRLLPASEIDMDYFVPEEGRLRTRLQKEPAKNAVAICADVNALPFREPLFDWVHCGHLLDLIDDPAALLQQLIRIMKPGALLTICTPWDLPDEGFFDELLEILSTHFKETFNMDGIPWLRFHHKRRFVLHEDWLWAGKLVA